MQFDLTDIKRLLCYYMTKADYHLPNSTRRKAKDLLLLSDVALAEKIVDELIVFFARKNNDFKRTEFPFLSNLMLRNRDAEIEKRRLILKQKLQVKLRRKDWKTVLFNPNVQNDINVYFIPIAYNGSEAEPLVLNRNRFRFFKGVGALSTYAFGGSNFATSIKKYLHNEESHVVDAVGAWHLQQGDVLVGVGDGCGGHLRMTINDFKNPRFPTEKEQVEALEKENRDLRYQDKQIARSAHFGIKHAFRLFASFDKPEELKRKLNSIVEMVRGEVERKAQGERTTLACVRAFPIGNKYRLIGFHIGDSYIGAYHAAKKKFKTVAPAIVTLPSEYQEATAQLPGYNDFEIHAIDMTLEPGYVLLAMSDGYTDFLPLKKEKKVYGNGLDYNQVSLDGDKMVELLKPVNGEPYTFKILQHLTRKVLDETNKKRVAFRNADLATRGELMIGDDMAAISALLQPMSPPSSSKGKKIR